MKISVLSRIFKGMSFDEILNIAKKAGYDGIEIHSLDENISYDTPLSKIKEYKKMLDEYGLEVSAISSEVSGFTTQSDRKCENNMAIIESYLSVMDVLGCDILGLQLGGPNSFMAKEYHYQKAIYWLSKCATLAEEYGKKIAVEIKNSTIVENADDANNIIQNINSPACGFIHNGDDMYMADSDFGLDSVKLLGDRIFHVHIQDCMRIKDDNVPSSFHTRTIYGDEIFQHRLLGTGAIDYFPLIKSLCRIDYKGYLSCSCLFEIGDISKVDFEFNELKNLIKLSKQDLRNYVY